MDNLNSTRPSVNISITEPNTRVSDIPADDGRSVRPGCIGVVSAEKATRAHRRAVALLAAAALLVWPAVTTPAVASADESQYETFYTPPDPLPDLAAGDLIRSEPSRLVLEPSGQLGAYVATGTRIMYRSNDMRGRPIAVTGTYFEPDNPWPGAGPRPLIAFATNVYGIGDQCAPSRLFNQGIHYSSGIDITMGYEEGFIATMVARGFAVVVTDYEGVGTPAPATPFIRLPQAQALIDAARAAMQLPQTSLDPHGPVAFWGYGQGGGASAAAVELAPSYAPTMHVVGAYAGAPPADLALIPPFIDGSLLAGGLGLLLNGIGAAYPELAPGLAGALNDRGMKLLEKTQNDCVGALVMRFAFRHVQPYFTSDYNELINSEPLKTVLADQRIGELRPNAPVFIDSNRYDPFIPWGGAHQLALDWCAKGADVEFWTNEQPPFLNKLAINYFLTNYVDGERGMQWIADRFNGAPTAPNCGAI
ncbi:lipase family protein [Mycobacterium sp. M23085]|uniref:lipase family protein n=1 Tax=Mycobacterium sp. M23085 TaxID=3378087 RepID=UPI0038782D28